MNDDVIQDFKQLIDTSNAQSEQRMLAEESKQLAEVRELINEVIDGTNQQTETIIQHIDQSAASSNAKIDDHEVRINRLERHAA